MDIQSLFKECAELGASDIHIWEAMPIMFRVEWKLVPSASGVFPGKILMFDFLYNLFYKKKEKISSFKHTMEADFWFICEDQTSYRGNAFMYMWKIGIVLRRIPDTIKNMIELGIPTSISKALLAKQWLFLVTGPTGSGKSTTMASMLDAINEFRTDHILTIEDPIEYIFKNKKSIISQREVGRDTLSFSSAIRAAMREDANIIMIGEIRDAETMEVALSLAETGHLVMSTLHTSGSVETINRMLQFFPATIETQIRARIASSLVGVISQRLIPLKDGSGRIAIREIMYVTSPIKNLINKWDLLQIPNTIETSSDEWMITMKKSADNLRNEWLVEEKSYSGYFINDTDDFRDERKEVIAEEYVSLKID
jgi:twitching motility protein PilT